MNLDSMAVRMQSGGAGTVGKTIFTLEMPTSCKEGVLLMDFYSGTEIDPYLDGFFRSEFRLVVRSVDYAAGQVLVKKAVNAIKSEVGYEVQDMTIRRCAPLNMPRPYRRSVGGYWEFEVDIEVAFLATPY